MKQYEITSNDAHQRLDKFLKKLFPGATLSFIYKCNRKGNIKVLIENKKTKQDNEYKLQLGNVIQVYLSDTDINNLRSEQKKEIITVSEKLEKRDIVFEDEGLLIVNKNTGQNVHPGDHKSKEVSLIEQVQDYFGDTLNSLTFKPSLIHRIDRDTSGIIMIAKSKAVLTKLSTDFQKKDALKKRYFCIVLGKLSRPSGTIRKKLKRLENAHNENKIQVSETGLEATTHYTLIDEYALQIPDGEQIISTLEVTIETGRMHQIRVHMMALGNPILGDKIYGDKSLNGYFAKHFGVSRQMLHAWKIEFFHPEKKKKMNLEAILKKDMIHFLKKLKK